MNGDNEKMEEIEIIVARNIKNPYYREKFCRDGYAKILLRRLNYNTDPSDSIKYAHEYITYINKYDHDLEHDMSFQIGSAVGYYFIFNSAGIMISSEIINLIHDCRDDFKQCCDNAKFRQLSEPEEEIANSIEDEDQRRRFILDTEAKTLYNLIGKCRIYDKVIINEAVDQYVAFIKDTYGIEVNIDRRTFKPLKINRNIDRHDSSETSNILPVHSEPHCYSYNISNAKLNELFDWLTLQVQNETNQEARQAYCRVLDAIKVICDKDRFSRLSIDEKIAVMHFLEDNEL